MTALWEVSREARAGRFGLLDSRQLLQLAQDTTPDGRYALTSAVSDFFEHSELNEMEHRLVVEIMMHLVRQAEIDLRAALAERLAVLSNVPAEVIIFLANDDILVARPVLMHSKVLNDVDLVYIISSKGEEYWRSIAQREQVSPGVAGRLIETGDAITAINLLENSRISLPKSSLKRLVKTSLNFERLQESLLRAPGIDGALAADLYICVSQTLQREIIRRFRIPNATIETALDNLVEELCFETKGTLRVTPEMVALAARFNARQEITPGLMIKTLRRGQISFFVALLAAKMELPVDSIDKLLKKESGKPFAVACRSIGMMKSEFASIYLLSRPARTEEKVVDQRQMADALKYFDNLRDVDVKRNLKDWARDPDMI